MCLYCLFYFQKKGGNTWEQKQWCWRDIQTRTFAIIYTQTQKGKTRDFLARYSKAEKGKCTRVVACEIINRTTAYLAVENQNTKRKLSKRCTLLYAHYYQRILQLCSRNDRRRRSYLYSFAKILQLTPQVPNRVSGGEKMLGKYQKTERNPKTKVHTI